MQGEVLYPLNDLSTKWPDVYAREAAKYQGREALMHVQLPYLNCLWNDVLQFSTVHPALIRDAVIAAGHKWHTVRCFEIDPVACGLTPETTLLYTYQTPWTELAPPAQDFLRFEPAQLKAYSALPDRARAYYQQSKEQPLLFAGIPHVLHKGALSTRGFAQIIV